MFSYLKSLFRNHDRVRIAILEPDVYPAIERIRSGFQETLQDFNTVSYRYRIFNAAGCKNKLKTSIEHIARDDFDLIFTIGTQCSLAAKEMLKLLEHDIPLVFTDVKDPVEMKLIDSYVSSSNNITGVIAFNHDYFDHFNHLLMLRSNLKKVLLIYNPLLEGGLNRKEVEKIEIHLAHKLVDLDVIEVYSKRDVVPSLKSYLAEKHPDVIITLRDSTVMPVMPDLLKLGFSKQIPVFTSDLESVTLGASFGSGFSDYALGAESAKLAHMLIKKNYNPAHIPVTLLHEDYHVRVNQEALKNLGITFSEKALKWLTQHGEAL